MKKKFLSVMVAVLSSVLVAACFFDKKSDSVVVVVSPDFAPFSSKKDGELIGFDIDLANKIAEKLGKKVTFQEASSAQFAALIQDKKADLVISAFEISNAKRELFAFSDPYFQDSLVIVYLKNKFHFTDVSELKGKIIGVRTGSAMEEALSNNSLISNLTVMPQDNEDQLFDNLKSGRVDAVLLSQSQLSLFLAKDVDLTYIQAAAIPISGYVVAMHQDTDLKEKVDHIISELKEEGFIDGLLKKWIVEVEESTDDVKQNHSDVVPGNINESTTPNTAEALKVTTVLDNTQDSNVTSVNNTATGANSTTEQPAATDAEANDGIATTKSEQAQPASVTEATSASEVQQAKQQAKQ